MKITASTGAIADAFVLAASLSADDKCAKKIATLEAIRIKILRSRALRASTCPSVRSSR
jgi:hypothetical protein